MDGTQAWYESKTIWGAVIAAVSGIMAIAGHAIPADQQSFLTSTITTIATAVGTIVGAAIAVWGRYTAKKSIG